MTDALQDLGLYACILGAAARVYLSASRWMARKPMVAVALGALLGTAYVVGAALGAAWRDTPASMATWDTVFVALAGMLGGLAASAACAGIVAFAVLLLPALHAVSSVQAWEWQLLAAAAAGVLARVLLKSAPGWLRYVIIFVLGYGLGLLPGFSLEQGAAALTAALPWCTALAMCLGYRAFAGLLMPSNVGAENARTENEDDSSVRQALAQHALILENAIEGIALLASDGTIVQVNPALGELVGIPHEALVGKPWLELAPSSERGALSEAFRAAYAEGRAVVECVLCDREASFPVEFTLVRDAAAPGEMPSLHLLARDLRERRATARFEHLALHDQLTGLPNRRALLDRLEDSLRTSPGRPAKIAVLLFDIDRFKYINDEFGHAAGDAVLKHTASQMARAVRPSDTLARLGGDEFVLIARGIEAMAHAEDLAERFRAEAARPLRIGGTEISIKLSTGIALAGHSLDSAETILEAADRAMYADKARAHGTGWTGVHLRETKSLFGRARGKPR